MTALSVTTGDGGRGKPRPLAPDRRLAARYGADALAAGYAAIPHVVLKYRRALGITATEWDYLCELWSHWRTAELPRPSVEVLASGLGVDASTIRRYRASLERKGLLRVIPDGPCHRYDLTPLIAAAVGRDRIQTADRPATSVAVACSSARERCAELHAIEEVERNVDFDSMPPYPPLHPPEDTPDSKGGTPLGASRKCAFPHRRPADCPVSTAPMTESGISNDGEAPALTALLAALSAELGDLHPRSSLTRAAALLRDHGASPADGLILVGEAAARTRAHEPSIYLCGPDGQPNCMPYFFSVLIDLLHPAPRQEHDGPAICMDHRRGDRARHRRGNGRRHEINRVVTAPGRPVARLPITEPHPVWHAALTELSSVLTVENFNTWLAPTRVLAQEGDLLRIAVPRPFHKDWLEHKLCARVLQALRRLDYGRLDSAGVRVERVEYVVAAAA